MIKSIDVQKVADDLGITLTPEQIDYVIENYESEAANDPTGTWDLIIENLIYQILT